MSVVVLTRDEQKHLRACLASVREFADELLVLDSGSTDGTVEIAQEMDARVELRAFDNYPAQRNAAIDLARGDWIFFIDADERATPALAAELQSLTSNLQSPLVGYWIPRRNIIFGKEIRYTGWSPDYQPRVLKKGFGHFDLTRHVHELLVWDGKAGYLREPLIHYNYESLAQFRAKQIAYTRYEAQVWFNEGKRARARGFVGQPVREFFRRYVLLQGWRDGAHGLLLSVLMAYYAFVRQRMLWGIENTIDRSGESR
ncbi:MAG: glycosyltransferase family 2 protein [Chloroflexi bacterium]|nr:glycosyltransferase family 2 protein [Chloroflexota bacterium]